MIHNKTIIQIFPKIKTGGLERGAIDTAIFLAKQGYHSIVVAKKIDLDLAYKLSDSNVKIIDLDIGNKFFLRAYKNIKVLKKTLIALQPDLIHVRSRLPIWISFFSIKNLKIPFITSIHGLHDNGFLNYKKIYNKGLFKGQRVIFSNQSMVNYYSTKYSIPKEKIIIIPPGIDTNYFSPKKIDKHILQQLKVKYRIQKNCKVIMLPARVSTLKGHYIFIQAIIELLHYYQKPLIAIMIGSIDNSAYYKKCQNLITNHRLKNIIYFVPQTEHMREALFLADIIVSSSIKPESFGRAIAEAMSMEKIVVATGLGGSLDLIKNNITGFLVEEQNSTALCIQLMNCLNTLNQDGYKELKKNARNFIENNFSKSRVMNLTLDAYQNFI